MAKSIKAAMKWIRGLTAEPEVGQIYDGKIVKVMDFGAFVNFFGPKDGLVHVSELAASRVAKPKDVVKEGQAVKVKLLGFDDRGKVRLSMKQVDQATGEDLGKKPAPGGSAAGLIGLKLPILRSRKPSAARGRLLSLRAVNRWLTARWPFLWPAPARAICPPWPS